VTDAKLGEVALVAGCSRAVAIATWHAILESCASVNQGGRFDTTSRRVAVILSEPVQIIDAVFAELDSLGMIEGNVATAWAKRQFESDSSTERSGRIRPSPWRRAAGRHHDDAARHSTHSGPDQGPANRCDQRADV
jgi:hypothetical protein